jgi:RNA polymerase-binding transcription factor DksA
VSNFNDEALHQTDFPIDPVDIATHNESLLLDMNVKNIQNFASQRESHPDFDGKTCISCGDDIPPERLAAGRIRCTYCQSEIERRKRFYA